MRKVVLVAAVLVHGALLLAWRMQIVEKPDNVGRETTLYLLAPPPKAMPPQRRAPVNKPRPAVQAARAVSGPEQAVFEQATPEAAASTLAQPPDGLANPSATTGEQPGGSLLESSRQLARGVYQQLRKEKEAREVIVKPEIDLTERLKEVHNDYSDVPSHTHTLGGDRLDRVEGPHGIYCVRTNGNGPGSGRDPFKDAGKQVVVNCPQRGPLSNDFVRRKKKSGQ